ncbi:MAG: hypothetical protein QXT25_03260 [Candidatus Anstonellaceae archaeon]
MAKVFINRPIQFQGERIWEAQNGATRRKLLIINKTGDHEEPVSELRCSLGFLKKNRTSFIFINPERPGDERILGIFLGGGCNHKLVEGQELFKGESWGGYGNSCSSFGIYSLGSVVEDYTYKNRQPSTFYKLTTDGWVVVDDYQVFEGEIEEI